jgi:hypothetical protein
MIMRFDRVTRIIMEGNSRVAAHLTRKAFASEFRKRAIPQSFPYAVAITSPTTMIASADGQVSRN